jgi:hypothetical protein
MPRGGLEAVEKLIEEYEQLELRSRSGTRS